MSGARIHEAGPSSTIQNNARAFSAAESAFSVGVESLAHSASLHLESLASLPLWVRLVALGVLCLVASLLVRNLNLAYERLRLTLLGSPPTDGTTGDDDCDDSANRFETGYDEYDDGGDVGGFDGRRVRRRSALDH